MRIRSTKPEFWRSERIASVSWDARLVIKGLESYVDDNGVGKDDLALIIGDLFQRDLIREPSRTLARVSEAISELHEAGLVWRYEAENTPLLFISFWEQVQRVDKPQPGRFPRPDGTKNYKESVIRESVANIRESSRALAPGTGEQGNRGTVLLSEVADATPDAEPLREDVERLCTLLADRIEANGSRRPNVTQKWRNAARLMLDADGRTEEQVAWIIDWCQRNEFWRSNVMSMPKVREKFDQMRLKAGVGGNVTPLRNQDGDPILPPPRTKDWLQ